MRPRLRAPKPPVPFHVVLVEPEIPQNTGNIARLCAATQCPLHLVGRLGFSLDERAVRRAGVDYWHLVDVRLHAAWEDFLAGHGGAGRVRLFAASGARSYLDADFAPGDALVFGKESVGLPAALLDRYTDAVYGIPTVGAVRSLNLASAAAVVVYEALRQTGAFARAALEETPAEAHPEPADFPR